MVRISPVVAASFASRYSFAPSLLETNALTPTPVPTATAICSIWAEYASEVAVSACSLIRATKMLSTMLYMDCTTMEIIIGTAMDNTSLGTDMTPILFSFCISYLFLFAKTKSVKIQRTSNPQYFHAKMPANHF